jgi:hypothetical protein
VPVAPEVRVVLEAIAAGRAYPGKHAHGPTAEPELVGEPVLLLRELDQLRPRDGPVGKRHAVAMIVRACVDDENGPRPSGRAGGLRGRGDGYQPSDECRGDREADLQLGQLQRGARFVTSASPIGSGLPRRAGTAAIVAATLGAP